MVGEPNYPSVMNKPAATQPDTSDKFMTEATSMVVPGVRSWYLGVQVVMNYTKEEETIK